MVLGTRHFCIASIPKTSTAESKVNTDEAWIGKEHKVWTPFSSFTQQILTSLIANCPVSTISFFFFILPSIKRESNSFFSNIYNMLNTFLEKNKTRRFFFIAFNFFYYLYRCYYRSLDNCLITTDFKLDNQALLPLPPPKNCSIWLQILLLLSKLSERHNLFFNSWRFMQHNNVWNIQKWTNICYLLFFNI